jgi:hypothetical protein
MDTLLMVYTEMSNTLPTKRVSDWLGLKQTNLELREVVQRMSI